MTTLIFGGGGGIGSALASALAASGEPCHIVGRDGGRLAAVAAETGASWSVCDVTEPDAVAQAVEAAGEGLSGLAYCVGSIRLKPLAKMTEAEMAEDFRLNAIGAALALQAAAPSLKNARGTAVLFSTVAVAQGFASHVSISMAKGAVEGLTRAAAAELAPHVRVNCIAPSLTRTPLAAGLVNSPMAGTIAQMHALQRLGEPEDAAALAAFLLSRQSGWITGQIIGVDGGRAALRTKG
jgi:NAD(P)-dependent dehydrogenase (short-subunit alcohol dehydrogenase family)